MTGERRIVSDFYKMGPRRAQIISACCVAGWMEVERISPGRNRIVEIRMAAGGVAPKTRRLRSVETCLKGQELTGPVIASALDRAAMDISPISDVRGSSEYKGLLTRNFIRMFLDMGGGIFENKTGIRENNVRIQEVG